MQTSDQFLKAKTLNKYPDYNEGPIYYLPTYKRNKFDSDFHDKKNQSPSFTDRILIKNNTCLGINLNIYNSNEKVLGSDHRPVYSDFSIQKRTPNFIDFA